MTNKMFDSFGAVKNALEKAKNTAVGKATEALDANNDGTVDIQDIIILAIKLPGVHITRESFLRKELFKNYPPEVIDDAVARTPALAGISEADNDRIADEVIKFERNCVSGISAALGVPGGAAMAATIPADVVQYYGYTLRAIQKLLYLYGFPEIDSDGEGISLDISSTIRRSILMRRFVKYCRMRNAENSIRRWWKWILHLKDPLLLLM